MSLEDTNLFWSPETAFPRYLTLPFQEDEHFREAIWCQAESFLLLGRKQPSVISEGMENSQTLWDMCVAGRILQNSQGRN